MTTATRRIDELERRLEDAMRLLDQIQGQQGRRVDRQQVRLAKTTISSKDAQYPGIGDENAFAVNFVDPEFTEDATNPQTITTVDQLAVDDVERVAATVPPRYILEETLVAVVEIDGQFYILGGEGKELIKANVGDDAIPPDTEGFIFLLEFPEDIEIGVWDWAHGNLTIEPGTEIWVQVRDDGKYDIVGVDCVGVTQGTGGGQILIP